METLIVVLLCFSVLVCCIPFIYWMIRNRSALQKSQPPLKRSTPARKTAVKNDPVRRATQTRLRAMLNGDVQTMTRLLERARERNPGRSEQWIWEKVIFDLERDRRS